MKHKPDLQGAGAKEAGFLVLCHVFRGNLVFGQHSLLLHNLHSCVVTLLLILILLPLRLKVALLRIQSIIIIIILFNRKTDRILEKYQFSPLKKWWAKVLPYKVITILTDYYWHHPSIVNEREGDGGRERGVRSSGQRI